MKKAVLILLCLTLASTAWSQWEINHQMGFKFQKPSDWTMNKYEEGTDMVYDLTSPDENLFIQVRAFENMEGLTLDLMALTFEASFGNSISQLVYEESNTTYLEGNVAVYTIQVDGAPYDMVTFYSITGPTAFILWSLTAEGQLGNYAGQIDEVWNTVEMLEGNNNVAHTAQTIEQPTVFTIQEVTMADQITEDARVINATTNFNPNTPEIHAVIRANTSCSDLYVRWIYNETDYLINEEVYTMDDGGQGAVSLSRPNNGWPIGSYSLEIVHEGNTLSRAFFKVTQ